MFDLIPFRNRQRRNWLEVEDVFDRFLNEFNPWAETYPHFRADIRETEQEYILEAELPGIPKDKIQIEVNGDYLSIKADNDEIIEEEKDNYIRRERRLGRFQRSFYINNVKQDEIKANYEDGLLRITLPKKESTNHSRRIDIN